MTDAAALAPMPTGPGDGPARPIRPARPVWIAWFFNPFVQILLGALMDAAGELLMKRGADSAAVTGGAAGLFGVAALASVWTWLGITSKILSLLSWLYVLRFVPLSVAFPLNNVVNVLVPVGAHVFLHEHVPVGRWVGIGLIMCGALLILKPLIRAEEKL